MSTISETTVKVVTPRDAVDYLIWPVLVAATLLIAVALSRLGAGLATATIGALTISRGLVAILEIIRPRDLDMAFHKDRFVIGDLGYTLIKLVSGRYFTMLAVYVAIQAEWVRQLHLWPSDWPMVGQFCLFYGIYTFLNYWEHRLDHEVPLLWRFHAIHHAPDVMHHFKKDRQHVVMVFWFYLLVVFPLMLVGAPADLFLWAAFWEGVNTTIKHSNVRHKLPRFAHYLIPSADLHHLHHSRDMRQGNSNYASFPLWDVLFGTYTPHDAPHPGYGVEGEVIPSGFVASNLQPLLPFWRWKP